MFTAYIVVSLLAAAANAFSASCDFIRPKHLLALMADTRVPVSWLPTLGMLKLAGALGLLVGTRVPLIGVAAAIGLVMFYVGAVAAHLRVRDYAVGLPTAFLLLAVAALALRLAMR